MKKNLWIIPLISVAPKSTLMLIYTWSIAVYYKFIWVLYTSFSDDPVFPCRHRRASAHIPPLLAGVCTSYDLLLVGCLETFLGSRKVMIIIKLFLVRLKVEHYFQLSTSSSGAKSPCQFLLTEFSWSIYHRSCINL